MTVRTRNQVVAFRVTLSERKRFGVKVKRSGLSQQKYLLSAVLDQPIYVVVELKPILAELRACGGNLNQPSCPTRGVRSGPSTARGHPYPGQDL